MGVQVEWMEFEDYMSFMIYYEGIAVQGEVDVKPHIIDTALMLISFCKTKRGRALLAQAAAGIDAAATDDGASTVEAGGYVEANVESLLCEGAKQLEDYLCQGNYRQGEASLEGSEINSTGH